MISRNLDKLPPLGLSKLTRASKGRGLIELNPYNVYRLKTGPIAVGVRWETPPNYGYLGSCDGIKIYRKSSKARRTLPRELKRGALDKLVCRADMRGVRLLSLNEDSISRICAAKEMGWITVTDKKSYDHKEYGVIFYYGGMCFRRKGWVRDDLEKLTLEYLNKRKA